MLRDKRFKWKNYHDQELVNAVHPKFNCSRLQTSWSQMNRSQGIQINWLKILADILIHLYQLRIEQLHCFPIDYVSRFNSETDERFFLDMAWDGLEFDWYATIIKWIALRLHNKTSQFIMKIVVGKKNDGQIKSYCTGKYDILLWTGPRNSCKTDFIREDQKQFW